MPPEGDGKVGLNSCPNDTLTGSPKPDWTSSMPASLAAEKACKAVHLFLGGDAWGHDLTRLMELLPPSHEAPADLVDRAKALDKHYLPARYPNGFAAGTPREHYTGREAEQAIADADAIIEFCARSIPR